MLTVYNHRIICIRKLFIQTGHFVLKFILKMSDEQLCIYNIMYTCTYLTANKSISI